MYKVTHRIFTELDIIKDKMEDYLNQMEKEGFNLMTTTVTRYFTQKKNAYEFIFKRNDK